MIGITHNSKPIAGVINLPFSKYPKCYSDQVIWGIYGIGKKINLNKYCINRYSKIL